MEGDDFGTPPPAPNRSIDVELSGQEIVAIDLDSLDPDPQDYIDLLLEAKGNATVSMWTRLACEYCKLGLFDSAEKILESAISQYEHDYASKDSLGPVYQLLANIELARAQKAPKIILEKARQDNLIKEKPKEFYYSRAASKINHTGTTSENDLGAILTRGIFHLAKAKLDDAMRLFTLVLNKKPTNVVALLGKARIAYARKQYPLSLRTFQRVLELKPDARPDPRIGIGLCLWAMGQKDRAKMCWERSLEVHPNNWISSLLLGLEAINASKNPDEDDAERTESFIKGTKYCERAFKLNNRNAATANVLFDLFLQRGDKKVALKLAERTIQFAETLALFSAGHINAGRLAQMEGSTTEAMKHFNAALKGNPKNVMAAIGLAQTQIKADEISSAIHTLDTLMQPPNPQRCLEVTVLLGSLRASPRPGFTSSESAAERQKARDLFENVLKALDLFHPPGINGNSERIRSKEERYLQRKALTNFGDDIDLFIECARLWQDENRDRMRRLLEEAVHVVQERVKTGGATEPRLVNNLAVLKHSAGEFAEARSMYETALTEVSAVEGTAGESMATTILFNLARVYEDQAETNLAKEAYDKLLGRHPEYADAKVRQSYIQESLGRYEDAHEWLKAASSSQKSNLSLRGAVAHFLISRQTMKVAKDFTTTTLKDGGSSDAYSLCASGWVYFNLARENRDPSPAAVADRRKHFMRAAEIFERALQVDSKCAFAAQGLAIIAAEDSLGAIGKPAGAPPGADDAIRRMQGTREALDIFAKVRESTNDSSVYVNMGHCYFFRDEFDRAIESYETAFKRCSGPDVTVIHCLCRAWYSKAIKDQSFVALRSALKFAQRAQHLAPHEKANVYNLAMIEQKACEMLIGTPPTKRNLPDLKRAIEYGQHAQHVFATLAGDKSPSVPYSREIADQRRKYGESILKRSEEQITSQEQHEAAQEARLAEARQKRLDEKRRVQEAAEQRAAEIEAAARELAEQRRKAREEVKEWTKEFEDSDDDREKEGKKGRKGTKKARPETTSAITTDNDAPAPVEVKRRRKGKLKKATNGAAASSAPVSGAEVDGSEEEALFSGGEDEDRPKKRLQKKRVVRDDDDEEAVSAAPRKKQFKSKETISDSDEEMS